MSGYASTLNQDAIALLERVKASGRRPFYEMSVTEARELFRTSSLATAFRTRFGGVQFDRTVELNGRNIRFRTYTAVEQAQNQAPAILYFHGGGWVLGDLDTHGAICETIAAMGTAAVISIEYSLAPDHPAPAAFEDAFAFYGFAVRSASELGIDRNRIALMGDSAGGAIAASLALALRENETKPVAQALFYPVADLGAETEGFKAFTSGGILVAETMRWFRSHYTPREELRFDWRVSPLRSHSLAGLPPTLVVTARHDPLCDEGHELVRRLEADAVPTTHIHLGDQMHAFLSHGGVIHSPLAVLQFACHFIHHNLSQAEA